MQKLKPFSTLLKESWAIYKSHFGVLISIASVPSIIFILVPTLAGSNAFLYFLGATAGLVFSVASAVALVYAIKDKVDFVPSYKKAFASFWSYAWNGFLVMAIVIGGFFMGLIPGIIFSIFFMFSIYAIAFEGDKGLGALTKSREYVRGYWWAVWWKIILITIIIGAVSSIPDILDGSFAGGFRAMLTGQEMAPGAPSLPRQLFDDIIPIILQPFLVAYLISIYRNRTHIKPELHGKKVEGKKGFWIFAAIWGVVAPLALLAVLAFFSVGEFIRQNPYYYQ